MKFYAERNNLLSAEIKIDIEKMKELFIQIYRYFDEKGYWECAFAGVNGSYGELLVQPTLAPSPHIFFLSHLHRLDVYPITQHYESYSEAELFSIIEVLYAHIAVYDQKTKQSITDAQKKEFREHMNGIMKLYNKGYFLESESGFIMELPNEPLENMLEDEVPSNMPPTTIDELKAAIKMFYRFDADLTNKKSAIVKLAGILEPIRGELKELLNAKYDINKNDHDKLIFDVVNNYNIRHNKADQLTGYDKEIWYDWMMQYYTSVIIAYYKLLLKKTS